MRQWSIRPFSAANDTDGLVKLFSSVSGFDGGVAVRSSAWVDAALATETYSGALWRVAVASNDAIVGAMTVGLIGTLRTEVVVAVNPAWRRQGIGTALLREAPTGRRLMMTTRASNGGATGLMLTSNFSERYRFARMRRPIGPVGAVKLPTWATLEEDRGLDVERYRRAAMAAFGDDTETDLNLLAVELARPKTRVLYLATPQGDQGVAVVSASDRCKKNERDGHGGSTVGVVERVGLARACRGKGLSRPFIRAALQALAEDGYRETEAVADKRRAPAVELYVQEGFAEVDEDVFWIRRDDNA